MFPVRILTLLALLLLPAAASAAEAHRVGSLGITDAWARPTAGRTPNGAVYLKITNQGQGADRLIAAQTPAASKAELHTMVAEGEVMKMRQVPAIEVAPGKSVELAPGGLHVMLIGLKGPLAGGRTIPLTVTFEKAGSTTIEVAIRRGESGGHAAHGAAPTSH